MSDLIDRQAAIDAIRTYLEDNQVEDADWHANGIEYEIEGLPSAQPEKTQLSGESTTKDSTFDCVSRQGAIDALADDLSYYGSGDERAFGMSRAIGIIEKLPLAQPQRWIPVTERMPENGHYYLWCSNGGNVQSDYYWDGFENGQKYGYTIVAWMPLPEAFKGENE